MAHGRCKESLSIPRATQKILKSSLFSSLTSKPKRWNLGLTLHPPTLNKTRNLSPFHLTTLPNVAPSQPHHPSTFPPFPTPPPPPPPPTTTIKACQNNIIRYSLSPNWFLRGGSQCQNGKANSNSPLSGSDLELLDLSSDFPTIRPLKYIVINPKNMPNIKSCCKTLLAFHSPKVIQHNFVLEFHKHSLQ